MIESIWLCDVKSPVDPFGRPKLVCPDTLSDGPALTARLALATMEALRTKAKSGLIPQVRHGGRGNVSVAIVGSKFDGTGLGKEQIEQIQVPRST